MAPLAQQVHDGAGLIADSRVFDRWGFGYGRDNQLQKRILQMALARAGGQRRALEIVALIPLHPVVVEHRVVYADEEDDRVRQCREPIPAWLRHPATPVSVARTAKGSSEFVRMSLT